MTTASVSQLYPRLVVADAARAIEFYAAAFGAKELERHTGPDGKIVHAAVAIGDAIVAIKDEDGGDLSPTTLGGSPVLLALDVTDADAVGEAMVAAGATVIYEIQDWEYGQRGGRLADPFGHLWMVSHPLPSPS